MLCKFNRFRTCCSCCGKVLQVLRFAGRRSFPMTQHSVMWGLRDGSITDLWTPVTQIPTKDTVQELYNVQGGFRRDYAKIQPKIEGAVPLPHLVTFTTPFLCGFNWLRRRNAPFGLAARFYSSLAALLCVESCTLPLYLAIVTTAVPWTSAPSVTHLRPACIQSRLMLCFPH